MTVSFDARSPWALDERVALRPESFGALAYNFETRRLTFLKHPKLVRVLELLADHDCAEDALAAADVGSEIRGPIVRGLAELAANNTIVARRP